MTKNVSLARHHFSVNFFGAVGYGALVFLWLLVLTALMGLVATTAQPQASSASFTTLVLGDIGTQIDTATEPAQPLNTSLRFGLIALLGVLGWIFLYFVAKITSRLVRHMLKLFGQKVTVESLATFKFFIAAAGLIGLVILLQFLPYELSYIKVAVALLGFVGGIVAVAAIWIQKLIVLRYRVAIDRVL